MIFERKKYLDELIAGRGCTSTCSNFKTKTTRTFEHR